MYIELHRTFQELQAPGREGDSSVLQPGRETLNLPTLLECRRVVLLAEGGSGKTWELWEMARRLHREGRPAFFLRLEHVTDGIDTALEAGHIDDLDAWLASEEPGWLLLDSVDESRLRSPQDFERAVRRVSARVAKASDRIHVVISGRPSAWRPRSDLDLCNRLFSRAKLGMESDPALEGADDFKVVRLEDLTSSQVEVYAAAAGIREIKPFLEAIERADAWSFTQRPQDLEELVGFWKEKGRIGSRLELMSSSVQRRLQDSQDRAEARPLAKARAQEGVETLAAALVLTRKQNIQVPDGQRSGPGLNARDLLGWNAGEISGLLQLSLFNPDVYGTVRFHHRSVLEYLAAQWFRRLLQQEVSRRRVEDLFFRVQYGLPVLPPSLRSLLPWLAIFDGRILARLQQSAPEILFEGGDPLQLPAAVRCAVMTDVCRQLASGLSNRLPATYSAIQRFASQDVSETVQRLIGEYKDHEDVAGFLMGMVWQGHIDAALPEALELAVSRRTPCLARLAAFRAVEAVGMPSDMGLIRSQFLAESGGLDRRCFAELLDLVEKPDATTLAWSMDCLSRLDDLDNKRSTGLNEAMARYFERCNPILVASVLDPLYALLIEPPLFDRSDYCLSIKNRWLRRSVGALLKRLIRERHPSALKPSAVGALHVLILDTHYDQEISGVREMNLPQLVTAWPELKWAWLWQLVVQRRTEHKDVNNWLVRGLMHPVAWDGHDFDAGIGAVRERESVEDQILALEVTHSLFVQTGRAQALHDELVRAAGDNQALVLRLQELDAPPEDDAALQELHRKNAEWTQQQKEKAERGLKQRREYAEALAGRLEILRDPGFDDSSLLSTEQAFLLEVMRDMEKGNSLRWTRAEWRSLEAEFGGAVALAFRDGMVAFWRKHVPQLLSEGAEVNTMPGADLFGLAGVTIDAIETPCFPQSLSVAEARLAFRYAVKEMNGFPDWFPTLFACHPRDLSAMLVTEIEFELNLQCTGPANQYVIARVYHAREWLSLYLADDILHLLAKQSTERAELLEDLLATAQASSLPDEVIAALSRHQMDTGNPRHRALWAASWTSADPTPAIDAVEHHLDVLGDDQKRTEFCMQYATHLLGSRRTMSRMRVGYRSPFILKRLYLLIHAHVRADVDIDRSGKGVYSPSLRDAAQEAREDVVRLLREIPGREAFLALQGLAAEHPRSEYRLWMAREALAKAQTDSERAAWSEAQVREFAEKYERAPANHRELFDLAVSRLIDLKSETEDGDHSLASVVILTERETQLRNWIAGWCSQHAHGRFVLPQEHELPDGKRPDLRWTCSTFPGAVPSELKIADNWTGPHLFERLERQLAGDYLRDSASTAGIYLLVWRGVKRRWELLDGRLVDFPALIAALQAHWRTVAHTHPGVEEIQVIGINLTKRGVPLAKHEAALVTTT